MTHLPTTSSTSRQLALAEAHQRNHTAIRKAVVAMMLTFPNRPPGEVDVIAEAYAAALGDLPAAKVADAARRCARGEVAGRNNAFAPSAAEIHAEAARLMAEDERLARYRESRATPLPPEPYIPADERERVSKGFDELLRELGGRMRMDRKQDAAE